MFQREVPRDFNMPKPTLPDIWFIYRSNPAISFWDTPSLVETIATFPFTVSFAYTVDETNFFADLLLPEATDLESLQMIKVGGTKFVEQFWTARGVVLRQPAVEPQGEARDFLTGFLTDEGKTRGRPVGVAVDPRGALLIADDLSNTIWRVAPARQAGTAAPASAPAPAR